LKITLTNIGKRFNRDRIFGGINHLFTQGAHTVIQGSNGSGKSTLLQIIAGNTAPSEGSLSYELHGKPLPQEDLFRNISFASPYMELLEELTLKEHVAFHAGLKAFRDGVEPAAVPELAGLSRSADKQIRHFSSGMKQRVRLSLAILSNTPLLLLDEPCSNLDPLAITWYQELIAAHTSDRIILVCSNQQEFEYGFCKERLRMEDFK